MRLTLDEIKKATDGKLYNENPYVCISGVSTDSRTVNDGELFVALKGENFDGHDFICNLPKNTGAVLCEREINTTLPYILVNDTYKALGNLSRYYRDTLTLDIVIGVTGSVGKTTTKELIARVLKNKYKTHYTKGNLNNHIGLPLTLCKTDEDTQAIVCEFGMSRLGEISYLTSIAKPNIAVITNIGVSHIENLGSREKIRDAKLEIIDGMQNGTLIIDGDEPLLNDEISKLKTSSHKVIRIGFSSDNDYYPCNIYKGNDYISFDIISSFGKERITMPVVGDHFIKNALFAYAVGIECNVSCEDIKNGLSSYESQGLRQRIYNKNGIKVIADCYNASPESMKASLSVLGESECRKIAVLGDMLELGFFSGKAHFEVGRIVAMKNVDLLFCLGEEAKKIKDGALFEGFSLENIYCFQDFHELSEKLKEIIKINDTVLFKASRRMKLENVIELAGLSE